MKKLVLIAAAGYAIAAVPALADTIVQTIPYDSGVLSIGNDVLGVPSPWQLGGARSYGGAFRQFDPSLGTLTNVSVSFDGAMTYASNVEAYATQPACQALGACAGTQVSFDDGYGFDGPGFPIFIDNTDQMFAFTHWVPGGQSSFVDPIDATLSPAPTAAAYGMLAPAGINGPAGIAGYIGSGMVTVGGGVDGDDSCFGGYTSSPPVPLVCTEDLNLATTLTYTYTPVPEPRSIWLLFTGLGMLGFVSWRRHGRRASA